MKKYPHCIIAIYLNIFWFLLELCSDIPIRSVFAVGFIIGWIVASVIRNRWLIGAILLVITVVCSIVDIEFLFRYAPMLFLCSGFVLSDTFTGGGKQQKSRGDVENYIYSVVLFAAVVGVLSWIRDVRHVEIQVDSEMFSLPVLGTVFLYICLGFFVIPGKNVRRKQSVPKKKTRLLLSLYAAGGVGCINGVVFSILDPYTFDANGFVFAWCVMIVIVSECAFVKSQFRMAILKKRISSMLRQDNT